MAFQFATCDVNHARDFIQSVYPDREIDFDAPAGGLCLTHRFFLR